MILKSHDSVFYCFLKYANLCCLKYFSEENLKVIPLCSVQDETISFNLEKADGTVVFTIIVLINIPDHRVSVEGEVRDISFSDDATLKKYLDEVTARSYHVIFWGQ